LAENGSFSDKRKAFLDILLQAKNEDLSLTSKDLQEEVDTFMFEGHDTSTSATSWTCHLIGSHPHIQEKLHAEIDRVFGKFFKYSRI
jgi:cytochrome P450